MKKEKIILAKIGIIVSIALPVLGWLFSHESYMSQKVYANENRITTLEADNKTLKEILQDIKTNQALTQSEIHTVQIDVSGVKEDVKQALLILNKYK